MESNILVKQKNIKKYRKDVAEDRKKFVKKITPEEKEQLRIQRSMEKYGAPYPI